VTELKQQHAEALTERSEIFTRLSSLRKQLAECAAQFSEAIDQSQQPIGSLEERRSAIGDAVTNLERRIGEINEPLTPLKEAEQHVRFLEQRLMSLTPEQEIAEDRLAAARQSVATLVDRLRQMASEYWGQEKALTDLSKGVAGAESRDLIQRASELVSGKDKIKEDWFNLRQRLTFARENVRYWEERNRQFQDVPPEGDRYAEVARTGGLTADEFKKLGLSDAEKEVLGVARDFARQGLSSADQIDRIVKDVNAVMCKFSRRRFKVDSVLEAHSNTFAGATNERKAEKLGEALVRSLTGNTDTRIPKMSDTVSVPQSHTESIRQAVTQIFDRYQNPVDAAQRSTREQLDAYGEGYALGQKELVDQVDGSLVLDERREGRQRLDVSRKLLEAVRIVTDNSAIDVAPAEVQQRFHALAKALAGFDPSTISVPFIQFHKEALKEEKIRELSQNQQLMQAAEAIVRPQLIAETTRQLDRFIELRAEAMGMVAFSAVRNTIRAAILAVMLDTPGAAVTSFSPAEHTHEIKDRLSSWGFPLDRFWPEVTMVLGQTFGPAELENWVASTILSDELVQKQADERRKRVEALRTETHQGGRGVGIGATTQEQLLSQVDRMQPGSWVKLTLDDQVEVQTGNTPVDPTSILGVNVKLAVGKMDSLEICRGSDYYELILLDGWDGRATGEPSANLLKAGLGFLASWNVRAAAMLEGTGHRVTGVTIRTANDEEGCEAMKAILQSLLTHGRIEPRHLSQAQHIMPGVERKGVVKAEVAAKALLNVIPTGWQDFGWPRLEAKVGVTGGYSYTSESLGNTNMTIEKRDHEVTVELSASIAARAILGVPIKNMAGDSQSASTDLLAAQGSTMFSYKVRNRVVRGPDGLVQAGTGKQRQLLAPGTGKEAAVSLMGGDLFQRVVAAIPAEARESIRALINDSRTGDMINMRCSLDERVRTEANRLLTEANGLRSGAIPSASQEAATKRAEELENKAQALLDDEDSYIPFKLQRVPVTETLSQLTPLNFVFASWGAIARGKGESVANEVELDVGLAMNLRRQGLMAAETRTRDGNPATYALNESRR
jgi:hypothetical protein